MRPSRSLVFALVVAGTSWVGCGSAQSTSSISSSDTIAQVPECALTCTLEAILQSECALTDQTCICNSQTVSDYAVPCVLDSCTIPEALLAQRFSAESCGLPVRNKGPFLSRIQWTCSGLAIAVVIFRILTKLPMWKGPTLGWDDWSIVAALVIYTVANVSLHRMIQNGLGQDIWMLSIKQITRQERLYWDSAFTYVLGFCCVKISIVLLYIRIFPKESVPAWFTWACRLTIGALVAAALALCIGNGVSSSINDCNWLAEDGDQEGNCLIQQRLVFASAAVNIFFDLIVFFLPLPVVIPLNMSTAKKLGACGVFMLGLFVTICSIIRLQYLVHWGNSQNPTWDNLDLALWSTVEANWSIICACLPTLARPIKLSWRKVRTAVSEYSKSGSRDRSKKGSILIDSQPAAARGAGAVDRDFKGYIEQRLYEGPTASCEDMELAHHPASKQTSSDF